jgi:hypothetical protein
VATSQGLGRRKPPLLQLAPWRALLGFGPLAQETGRTIAEALYHGGYPPPVVEIPFSWLQGPIRIRQDNPLQVAEVAQSGGATARAKDAALQPNDQVWKFTESIDSVVPTDPANFAQWVVDYYQEPRPRGRALTLKPLNTRTEAEIYRIMSVRQGTRIRLTGTPAGFPTGAAELVVEGIGHRIADARYLVWETTPIIGNTVGESGPWFYLDESRLSSSTELVPF